jgi:hypothetical protein
MLKLSDMKKKMTHQITYCNSVSGIYRISHGLWFDMIFIQRVLYFLSPSLGETMGDSFYHILYTNYSLDYIVT